MKFFFEKLRKIEKKLIEKENWKKKKKEKNIWSCEYLPSYSHWGWK